MTLDEALQAQSDASDALDNILREMKKYGRDNPDGTKNPVPEELVAKHDAAREAYMAAMDKVTEIDLA